MDQYGQFNNGGGGYGGFGGGYGGAEMAMPGGYGLVFRLLKMKIRRMIRAVKSKIVCPHISPEK